MNVSKRVEIERKVVRHLIRSMKKAGWGVCFVDDGERVAVKTERDVMDAVFAVDEASIIFSKPHLRGTLRRTAFIVLGNDGWDCVCDHSLSNPNMQEDDFERVMDEAIYPYCDRLCLKYGD